MDDEKAVEEEMRRKAMERLRAKIKKRQGPPGGSLREAWLR